MGVVAGLVPVVGLVVPGTIVKVLIIISDLCAVQPVDGYASVRAGVGGSGVVPGVYVGSAADNLEGGAVIPDVGMAGCGSVLDKRVVCADV